MDMPTEQKGGISTKRNSAYKSVPLWSEPQFNETDLYSQIIRYIVLSLRQMGQLTNWKTKVRANVCSLLTSGRTAKDVSPTSPLVTLLIASRFTPKPKRGATGIVSRQSTVGMKQQKLTWYQDTIYKCINSPDIRCPVCMAKSAREREQSLLQL